MSGDKIVIPKNPVQDRKELAQKVRDDLEAVAGKGTVSTKDVLAALKDLAGVQVALLEEIQELRKEVRGK